MMHINKSMVKSPANSFCKTSPISAYHHPASSCCGISFLQRSARCHRMTLVHSQLSRQWARHHHVWDICHWRQCFLSDESRFKLHHTDRWTWVHRWQGERHVDVCVDGTDGNASSSVIIWTGFYYGGKNELVVLDGTMNQQVYRRTLQLSLLPWTRPTFQNNFALVQENASPTQPEALGISWRTRAWQSWIGHPTVRIWNPQNTSGTRWQFISVTWTVLQLWQHNCVWLSNRPSTDPLQSHWSLLPTCLHLPVNYWCWRCYSRICDFWCWNAL